MLNFFKEAENTEFPSEDFIEIGKALVGLLERTISEIPTPQLSELPAYFSFRREPYALDVDSSGELGLLSSGPL
jgi:hypothetical protein